MKFSKITKAALARTSSPIPEAPAPAPAPAPAIPSRFSPTVRKPEPPAPAPLTPEEVALFERFKQHEAQRLAPVQVEHREQIQPQPPSGKTIRLRELMLAIEKDHAPHIEAAKAFRTIHDEALWEDQFTSFKQCCGSRMMQEHWVLEMIQSIEVYESLPPASRSLVRRNDELLELGKFKKADRAAILTRAAARDSLADCQAATRITDAARALGIKPEGTK